jgi:ADP-heptose:LPS heptosyltransferase
MSNLFRSVSLLLRLRQAKKAVRRILLQFDEWKKEQEPLPAYTVSGKKMLIIRLDDIGDYLLFRNNLGCYKNSPRWAGQEIVLLGNGAWKDLFVALDENTADRAIWIDKGEYARDPSYRLALWTRLREEGFGTVVCPSRTRPLLLDDLCVLATGAGRRLASANSFSDRAWNELSDSLYTDLFRTRDRLAHEFFFNAAFAEWCCERHFAGRRPEIAGSSVGQAEIAGTFGRPAGAFAGKIPEPYILCFIGSSTKSKRWPVERWAALVRLLTEKYSRKIIIAGGRDELAMAGVIQKQTGADSITGKATLVEMVGWVAGAVAIVTNDTMAAHLGVACNRPTLIIANGNNYFRFTDYAGAGIGNVITVYPQVFLRAREKQADGDFHHVAVTADIASITAEEVAGKLGLMIGDDLLSG